MIRVHLSNQETYEFTGEDLTASQNFDGFFTVSRKYYYESERTIRRWWRKENIRYRDYGYKTLMSFKFSLVERVEYTDE